MPKSRLYVFLYDTFLVTLIYFILFFNIQTSFIYALIVLLILSKISNISGGIVSRIFILLGKYVRSIFLLYGFPSIPILFFIGYSDVHLYVLCYTISFVSLIIFLFYVYRSLFVINPFYLYIGSHKSSRDYKLLFSDLWKYSPITFSLIKDKKIYHQLYGDSFYFNSIKNDLIGNLPGVYIKKVSKSRKYKYFKYLFVSPKLSSWIKCNNLIDKMRFVKISVIVFNPFAYEEFLFSVIKISGNKKSDVINLYKILKEGNSPMEYKSVLSDSISFYKGNNNNDVISESDEIIAPSKFFKKDIFKLGKNFSKTIYIGNDLVDNHSYISGKTGVGKSSLMKSLISQSIENNKRVILIDPHGLSSEILEGNGNIGEKVIHIDFSKLDFHFNPLLNKENFDTSLLTDSIVSLFKNLYSDFWGPQTEDIFRRSLRALILSDIPLSIYDIESFLTNFKFRKTILSNISDKDTIIYFENIFDKWGSMSQLDRISPILNKIGRIKGDSFLKDFLSSASPQLDFSKLFKNGKSIFIDVNKSIIGNDNSKFIGAFILSYLQQFILSSKENFRFSIYIDEFQNFVNDSFLFLLSESRKYGVNLVLSNQYISQVDLSYQDAILENCRNFFIFDQGGKSSNILSLKLNVQLAPISKYFMYVKIGNEYFFTIRLIK